MATVKVKLRPASTAGAAGTIVYRITHLRNTRQITTTIRVDPTDWNPATGRLLAPDGTIRSAQCRIDYDVALLCRIIDNLEASRLPYTAEEVVSRFRLAAPRISILGFLRQQIAHLEECNRLGTARNYKRAMDSLARYLHDRELPFTALTEEFVDGYGAFLEQRGIVRNSISFYMRILRAVYNRAVRERLTDQTFPFRNVYTGVDRTRKRAVNEKVIARLLRLDLDGSPTLSLVRDLFIFSYCTRGMAFVDMAYLRKSDIRDGAIHYVRHKTKQTLCVRIEPRIRQIMERHADPDSPYLFPILKSDLPEKAFTQYQSALSFYNRQLKQLSQLLHLDHGLSSYTARHSWATAARNHNIPLSVISAGMGHTSERTTRIYLTSLENSLIDTANRRIIAGLV